MDGTQRPTKAPSSRLPENHKETENKNEAPAAITNPIREIWILVISVDFPCDMKAEIHLFPATRRSMSFEASYGSF
ncbi:MAG: hypothetical protein DWH91_11835 [Planctomycetota bacterium]|nr:MAG: hypothetical protein DWH91_11835 [Planctomycetota bacterium]